jgi:hypothetical protein
MVRNKWLNAFLLLNTGRDILSMIKYVLKMVLLVLCVKNVILNKITKKNDFDYCAKCSITIENILNFI